MTFSEEGLPDKKALEQLSMLSEECGEYLPYEFTEEGLPDKKALEQLSMLSEECGEVIQCISKIIRHGWSSYNPYDPDATTNWEQLNRELEDLLAIIWCMNDEDEISVRHDQDTLENRWNKKLKWTHYQNNTTQE